MVWRQKTRSILLGQGSRDGYETLVCFTCMSLRCLYLNGRGTELPLNILINRQTAVDQNERIWRSDMSVDAKLLGWSVCGNISDHIRGGTDPDKFYQGTKMFSPGTKVYLGSAYWGMGGQKIHVIGLRRTSRDFVNCVIHIGVLENLRTSSVYSTSRWETLERLNARLFETEQNAAEYLSKCSEALTHERPEKLVTKTRSRLWPWRSGKKHAYRRG